MSLYCESCKRVFLEREAFVANAACPACGLLLRRASSVEVRSVVANWLVQNPRWVTKNPRRPRRPA